MTKNQVIGERICLARQAKGYSQQYVAEEIGAGDARYVSGWESGARPVPDKYKIKLAQCLGIPVEDLLPTEADHSTKLRRAVEQADIFKGPTTLHAIVEQLPDALVRRLPSKDLAIVLETINKAYHLGRSNCDAEMIDDNIVWIKKLNRAIEWHEEGAEYGTFEEEIAGGVKAIHYNAKIKDGTFVARFVDVKYPW